MDSIAPKGTESGESSDSATLSNLKTVSVPMSNVLVEEYPIRKIVKCMMFSYGDSEIINDNCADFMLSLIYEQLKNLLGKATKLCEIRGVKFIGYTEIIFFFRRHPLFIKRLVQYMKIKETIPNLIQQFTNQESSYDLKSQEQDDRYIRSKALLEALIEIDVYDEYLSLFEPINSLTDEIKIERMRRMAVRIKNMDKAMYERFSSARTVSFCSKNGKKSSSYSKFFLDWLESPAVEPGIVYILNYCATEILAIMVDNAVLCREQESKCPPIEADEHPAHALQLRHYNEALRRTPGYAQNRDFLFGYF